MRARNDDGGPAFPVLDLSKTQCSGMSLRDYFAARAFEVVNGHGARYGAEGAAQVAAYCYAMADAMLAERSK